MANNSVLGKTKVSSALVQTSVARGEAGLIVFEITLLSVAIGFASSSFLVGFLISVMVLLALLSTRIWIVLSYLISFIWGGVGYIFGYAFSGESLVAGLVTGFFVFSVMIGWHHWSLVYWRALVDKGQTPTA